MEAIARIFEFLKCQFQSRYILEDFEVIDTAQKVYMKGYNAVYVKNSGGVTALINGSLSIAPDEFYVSSNLKNQFFLADYQVTFDSGDTLGKNTGSTQRLELVFKYEQNANY